MRDALAQHHLRRITGGAARLLVVADLFIEELLDFGRCRQAREHLDRLAQVPTAPFRVARCAGADTQRIWRARRGACDDNSRVRIALDATYSLGKNLSGVGVYSREMMSGLARAHPDERFRFYYRPHRLFKSLSETLPPNASRRLLVGAPRADLFHALNQRWTGGRAAPSLLFTTCS